MLYQNRLEKIDSIEGLANLVQSVRFNCNNYEPTEFKGGMEERPVVKLEGRGLLDPPDVGQGAEQGAQPGNMPID